MKLKLKMDSNQLRRRALEQTVTVLRDTLLLTDDGTTRDCMNNAIGELLNAIEADKLTRVWEKAGLLPIGQRLQH